MQLSQPSLERFEALRGRFDQQQHFVVDLDRAFPPIRRNQPSDRIDAGRQALLDQRTRDPW